MAILFFNIFILAQTFVFIFGEEIQIGTKLDFDIPEQPEFYEEVKNNARIVKITENDASGPQPYSNTIVVKQNFASPVVKEYRNNQETNVFCKKNICIYGLEDLPSTKLSHSKKVINDFNVIISTTDDTVNKKEENEVPIVKGYRGVRPEDINYEQDEDDKPKNDNEQPSEIITNTNFGRPIVINTDKNGIRKPSFALTPPNFKTPDWTTNINWRSREPFTNIQYHVGLDTPNIQYYQSDNTQLSENIGKSGQDVRIPSGWASNWKPIVPKYPAEHFYHYNSNGRRSDFHRESSRFVTVCSCSKKPVIGDGPTRPRRPNPWIPETTTKVHIDDKLPKPFSKTNT